MELNIFTDGSCHWKSRLGGIGVFIEPNFYFSKGYKDTTISRMEGIALLTALRAIDKQQRITAKIYSDSEYIIKSFTDNRIARWEMIGWQGVANSDMWQAIVKEIRLHPNLKLKFNHVRGHQKDISGFTSNGNAVADLLANYKTKSIYHSDKEL